MESVGFVAAGEVKAEIEGVRSSTIFRQKQHKKQKSSKGTLFFVAAGLGFRTALSTNNPSQCLGSAQVPGLRR